MDFKIIAIRPLEHCNPKFSKVLAIGEYYYLYNEYKIEKNQVKFDPKIQQDLYSVNGKPVSISAIVGKNGSGKSSIVDLLYVSIFNLAFKVGILPEKDIDGIKIKFAPKVFVELYYKKGEAFYKLECQNQSISLLKQKDLKSKFVIYRKNNEIEKEDLQELFYTIAINYSHYSLNSRNLGNWVKSIFHKNDGYQTPVVLNPFRTEGNIDINNEEYLTYSRLITNLLVLTHHAKNQNQDISVRELSPGKVANDLKFTLNKKKAQFTEKTEKGIQKFLNDSVHKKEILDLVFIAFPVANKPRTFEVDDENLKTAFSYILKKLYRIIERYKPYQLNKFQFIETKIRFPETLDVDGNVVVDYYLHKSELRELLSILKIDPSHVTFKLRQAINFVENYWFYKTKLNTLIEINELAPELIKIAKNKKKNIIEIIPPSFLNVDIKFKTGGYFRSLSSGEKQKIFSSASYAYHLINLNSIIGNESYIKYNYANLIFDEIELYYHPELQRTFIKDFLDNISKIPLPSIDGINCIFITHSPFILSDIPSQNILFLNEKGKPESISMIGKTFGANIHDLLKHSFFLKHGYMGGFAKEKINSAINYLKGEPDNSQIEWNDISIAKFIEMISEPMIRISLIDLFNRKTFKTSNEIQKAINLLEQQKLEIEKPKK